MLASASTSIPYQSPADPAGLFSNALGASVLVIDSNHCPVVESSNQLTRYGFDASTKIPTIRGGLIVLPTSTQNPDDPTVMANSTITAGGTIFAPSFRILGSASVPAWGKNGRALSVQSGTYTDTTSAGPIAIQACVAFGINTIAASSAVACTDSVTVYIDGPPTDSGSFTSTNKWSLLIGSGNVSFPALLKTVDLTVTNTINGSINGNAATVSTNANLTGPVTSIGNATSIGAGAVTNTMLATYGQSSGIATLDGGGKVPTSQLPASVLGAVNYQGTWNASTNSPALASNVGTKGYYYKVATAGTTAINGISQWNVGDSIVFDGTTWDKIDGIANEVISVAGRFGVVTLSNTDISGLGTLATQNGTFSGTSSGTNTGDQTITLSGNVTGSGTGSFATTIANSAVTNAMLASYGLANGVATLGSDGLVPSSQLPVTATGLSLQQARRLVSARA